MIRDISNAYITLGYQDATCSLEKKDGIYIFNTYSEESKGLLDEVAETFPELTSGSIYIDDVLKFRYADQVGDGEFSFICNHLYDVNVHRVNSQSRENVFYIIRYSIEKMSHLHDDYSIRNEQIKSHITNTDWNIMYLSKDSETASYINSIDCSYKKFMELITGHSQDE